MRKQFLIRTNLNLFLELLSDYDVILYNWQILIKVFIIGKNQNEITSVDVCDLW